jgi:tetratricopeptide (TPR) repeat protein
VALRPEFFGANALLGATLYMLKDDERAYQTLSYAHRLNPADADTTDLLFKTSVSLAQQSFSRKEYRRSLGYLQEASQLRPENALIHRRMADVYALMARFDDAEREKREPDQLEGVRR